MMLVLSMNWNPNLKKLVFHGNLGDTQKRCKQVNSIFTLGQMSSLFVHCMAKHGVIYHFATPQETINDFAFYCSA